MKNKLKIVALKLGNTNGHNYFCIIEENDIDSLKE